MDEEDDVVSIHERMALLRHSIIGPLLAAPPERGKLQEALQGLSKKRWLDPRTRDWVSFGVSTIERWLYEAKDAADPVRVLRTKVRSDRGKHHIAPKVKDAVKELYDQHPTWDYKLHWDNLVAMAEKDTALQVPSYSTVKRHMQHSGLIKQKRRGEKDEEAEKQRESKEVRSFEKEYVHSLWHLDFHWCVRALLTPRGTWRRPKLFAVLDDCSRVVCHAQWYWEEEAAYTLYHGFSQAAMKRGLPRQQMSDGGGAMKAEEVRRGFAALGVGHVLTRPYSPEQNGKCEHFWTGIDDRLMPMLEGVPDLTLSDLNLATQAWVEREYNHHEHRELGESPLSRLLRTKSVGRPSPTAEELARSFRVRRSRNHRQSDGTISLEGQRFEIPACYRSCKKIHVTYARWDLSQVDMIDPRTGDALCPLYPLDRQKNADGRRARLSPVAKAGPPPPSGIAPLLKQLMAEYAASGLPPAYIPLSGEAAISTQESSTEQEDNA